MSLYRTLLLIALLSLSTVGYSQFVNAGSDAMELVYRDVVEKTDSTFIYAFHAPAKGILKAKSINGFSADFKWYKFNETSISVEASPFHSEIDVPFSSVENLEEGGYMVETKQEETDEDGNIAYVIDTFYSWIFIDTISISKIVWDNSCEALNLRASIDFRLQYSYYDFSRINDIANPYLTNNFTMEWSASEDIRQGISGDDSWEKSINYPQTAIMDPAPLKDSKYTAKVTNRFKCTAEFTSEVIPFMATYANFDLLRPNEAGIFLETKEAKGEALFRFKLKNTSINANKFLWEGYGNQKINFEKDRIIWSHETEEIDQIFEYKPGVFPVKISVENTITGCKSSTYLRKESGDTTSIQVDDSKFEAQSIPNAFTPNGDGKNDIFIFVKGQEPVSLNTIEVRVFSRNGSLVYDYKGRKEHWTGWNGKLKGTGSDCSPGVYYYVVSGKGWDNIDYSGKTFTGSLHLFR